jgi:uncharacterized protein YllA (UPF0747 family)
MLPKLILQNWLNQLKKGGYCAPQIFNIDETALFWKKMPASTFLAEKSAQGYKLAEDRITYCLVEMHQETLSTSPSLFTSLKP